MIQTIYNRLWIESRKAAVREDAFFCRFWEIRQEGFSKKPCEYGRSVKKNWPWPDLKNKYN